MFGSGWMYFCSHLTFNLRIIGKSHVQTVIHQWKPANTDAHQWSVSDFTPISSSSLLILFYLFMLGYIMTHTLLIQNKHTSLTKTELNTHWLDLSQNQNLSPNTFLFPQCSCLTETTEWEWAAEEKLNVSLRVPVTGDWFSQAGHALGFTSGSPYQYFLRSWLWPNVIMSHVFRLVCSACSQLGRWIHPHKSYYYYS